MAQTSTLKFLIDASAAEAGSRKFVAAINKINAAVKKLAKTSETAFAKIAKNANNFSGISKKLTIGNSAVNSFVKLGNAFKNLKPPTAAQTKNLVNFVNALNKLKVPRNAGRIARSLRDISNAAGRAQTSLSGLRGTVSTIGFRRFSSNAKRATTSMRGLENAFQGGFQAASLFRTALGAITLGTLAKGIFDSATSFAQLKNVLTTVLGSTAEADDAMSFLIRTTDELGVSLEGSASRFGKFVAALKLSGLSMGTIKDVFRGLTEAQAVFGATAEDTKLIMLAVEQIFGKGTLSAEELKRQLGERIPAAFELMEKVLRREGALKATESLADAMKKGAISSQAIIPFVKELSKIVSSGIAPALKRADTQLNRLNNKFVLLKKTVGEAGFMDALAESFKSLAETLDNEAVLQAAKSLGEGLASAVKTAIPAIEFLLQNLDLVAKAFAVVFGTLAISAAVRFFSSFATGFGLLSGGVGIVSSLVGVFLKLGKAFAFVTPLGLALKLILAQIFLFNASKGISAFQTLAGNISEARKEGASLRDVINGLATAGAETFTSLGDSISAWAAQAIAQIGAVFQVLQELLSAISGFDLVSSIGSKLKKLALESPSQTVNDADKFTEGGSKLRKFIKPLVREVLGFTKEGGVTEIRKTPPKGQGRIAPEESVFEGFARRAKERIQEAKLERLRTEERNRQTRLLDRRGNITSRDSGRFITPEEEKPLRGGSKSGSGGAKKKNLQDYIDLQRQEIELNKLSGEQHRQEAEFLKIANALKKNGVDIYSEANTEQRETLRNLIAINDQLKNPGPFQQYIDGIDSIGDAVEKLAASVTEDLADAFADFIVTGKADFKSLAQSILKDLAKIIIKSAIIKPLLGGLTSGGGFLSGLFGAAKGAAFANGGSFTNSVVNQPTPFLFGQGGALGVMGEAGHEAIMPLSRGSDGKLGVSSRGSGGGNTVNSVTIGDVNVRVAGGSSGDSAEDAKQAKQIGDTTRRAIEDLIDKKILKSNQYGGLNNPRGGQNF